MSIKSAPSPPLVIQTEPTVTISRFESTDTVETVGRLTAKTGNDAAVTAKLTATRDDTDLYAVVKDVLLYISYRSVECPCQRL